MKDKVQTLIFDVNETLLDLQKIKNSINAALGNKYATDIWFSELLHYSLVESITGTYHDFSEIAVSVLQMNAKKHDLAFTSDQIQDILRPMKELEAYPDVKPGLNKLKENGFQLIAFSNGKPAVLNEQLQYAGLTQLFDKIISVDSVRKYKPHPETYKFAVKEAGATLENCMMVAAHGWDITGAIRAGLSTSFIQRSGKFTFPLSKEPDIQTEDISSLAEILIGN